MKFNVAEQLSSLWKKPFIRFALIAILALFVAGLIWSIVSPAT